MPRQLLLSLDGRQIPVTLERIDRESLYGTVDIEAFDDKGKPAHLKVLAADGKTLIDKGGTALATVTKDGTSIDRDELLPVNIEGEKLEPVPSSFDAPNELIPATIEEYLSQIVKSVYLLSSPIDDDLDYLISHLSSGDIYKFQFSYRGGIEYDSAFVLGNASGTFMIVGKQAEFRFVKLNQATTLDSIEETEISADEIDFLL